MWQAIGELIALGEPEGFGITFNGTELAERVRVINTLSDTRSLVGCPSPRWDPLLVLQDPIAVW
jgi:hypothetical protein